MENNDITLDDIEPSFLSEGEPLSGFTPAQAPFTEDTTPWDVDSQTELNEQDDFQPTAGSCLADAGDPPDTGTYVLGSVDGTCQWINTTTCA